MIDELEKQNALLATDLTPLSVNRAVSASTLAKVDDFYVKGMGTKRVSDVSDASSSYTRKCYLWTGAEVDICFTSRDASATKGDFTVVDFENMLNTVHKNVIVGHPMCHTSVRQVALRRDPAADFPTSWIQLAGPSRQTSASQHCHQIALQCSLQGASRALTIQHASLELVHRTKLS